MKDLDSILHDAESEISAGNAEKALQTLQDLQPSFPDNHAGIAIRIGHALIRLGRFEEGARALSAAVASGTDDVWAYLHLCDALMALGAPGKAVALLEGVAANHRDVRPFNERLARARARERLDGHVFAVGDTSKPVSLVLGSSHINSVQDAHALVSPDGLRNAYQFKSIMNFKPDSRIIEPVDGDFETFSLIANLKEWLAGQGHVDRLFLSISGSDYLTLCIGTPNPSYDIVLPEQPDLPRIEGAQIIPYQELKNKLRRHIRHIVLGIRAIRSEFSGPIHYLESPPPIESNDHLRKNAGWAAHIFDACGPSDPILRYKLWRLHTDVVKEACAAAGVTFLPLPASVLNGRGFMAESALMNDLMHANVLFGAEILCQMDDLGR